MNRIMGSNEGVESMAPFASGGVEKILSIMLSTSELAKLDLSNIQLFQDNEKEVDPLSIARQDSFSLSLSLEAKAVVSTAPVQVFKSRDVIEAEKSMIQQNRVNNSRRKKKPVSMGGTRLDRFENREAAKTKKIKKAQDDSALHDKLLFPPLSIKTIRAEEERAEAEEITRKKPGIDLKSSHASKFLMQVMPWQFQPSPLYPFTPAAVPFKWEEVPGKPKTLHDAYPSQPQNNSFPVLHPPPRLLMPSPATKKLPARQPQPGAQRSRSSWVSCGAEERRVISVEMKRIEETPKSVIPSLEYKLPSPWNGDVKPAYSPFRDLGPPDDAVHRLLKKAASILISIWRKSITEMHKQNTYSVPPVDSCGSGEVLMDREPLWVAVNEGSGKDNSVNARIAVTMGGFDDNGFSNKTMKYFWEAQDLKPIPDPEYYMNGFKLVGMRPRRKRVMRKLRRPARFFRGLLKNMWRAISLGKSRHRKRGNSKLPYESLVR